MQEGSRGRSGARNQQTARAAESYVVAELNRRGAFAVSFAGNMPGIDVIASDVKRERVVFIQVKARRKGDWQTSTSHGREGSEDPDGSEFWVLVDLWKKDDEGPDYYIVPGWWIRNDIYQAHKQYLERHGGRRPRAQASDKPSTHHSVSLSRIAQWKDQWGQLNLF